MSAVQGRGPSGRSVTIGVTSGSTAVTAAAGTFDTTHDVGRAVYGVGIPAGATLAAVTSATAATLSANATATNASLAAQLGPRDTQARQRATEDYFGFRGWSPESVSEATAYQCTGPVGGAGPGTNEPSRITSPTVPRDRRYRQVNA